MDTNGNLAARYVFGSGIDEPLAAYSGAIWKFYQADGLGSITSLSTSGGTISDSFVYDSFGNVTSSTGAFTQPFMYTGREGDMETGLYYYRARYYSSDTGRFLSEDPTEFEGGENFYAYTINNPVNYVDPSGLLAELYCDNIGSSRGGSKNSLFLLLAHPTHCYIRVVCHGKDVYLELWGPPRNSDGTFAKYGLPHNDSPFNADRARNSTKHPLNPPPGMKCCEFEDRLMNAFSSMASNLPPYGAYPGSNSNTFAHDMIYRAGGTAEFPWNAYGWDFNVVKPPLVLHKPIVTPKH